MKALTINSLSIKNFKGIKDFSLEPAGKDISVWGDNGTGKTTLADAFYWLIFGKDSKDKADFQIKPVSASGEEKHNLETIVEADLSVNGNSIRLKKVFSEKYTKKRGTAVSEFTGHETEHFIDDVPVLKKAYDTKVSEIIDTKIFKLVTNPYGFSSLPWTERRAIVLEMCGALPDSEIINSDSSLSVLSEILKSCSIDDHKKKVKASQSKINEELKQIPARISENQEAVKNAIQPDQKEKDRLLDRLAKEKENIRALQSNEAVSLKQIRINEIKGSIQKAKNNFSESNNKEKLPIRDEINRLNTSISSKSYDIKTLHDGIARDQKRADILANELVSLRSKWEVENDKNPDIKDSCPTCGQNLPEDQIQSAVEKFNIQKSERLSEISKNGKDSRQMHDKLLIDIQESQAKIEAIEKEIASIHESIKNLSIKLASIDTTIPDFLKEQNEIDSLELEISALKNGSRVKENDIMNEISDLENQLSVWQVSSAKWEAAQRATDRIAELSEQEKNLAKEYERLESELFLIEKFIVKKVESMEGAINSRFKIARFKMFNQQVNGGIEECCEILCGGVPFDKGLNNAARINTGLDIINTMSEHFEFSAPVWIDNRESVNELIDTNAQVINLIVSKDKELTIK